MVGKGKITRDSSSSMLLIGRGRSREHPSGHFRCNGSTRADIVQLPVAHAQMQREPQRAHVTFGHFRYPWYLYYCIIFCTTTIVRKKGGKNPGMCRTYFRSLPVRVSFGHVTSGSASSQHLLKCDLSCTHILLFR